MSEKTQCALLAIIAALAVAMLVAVGGDDARDLEERAQWMAQAKEGGAWVLW